MTNVSECEIQFTYRAQSMEAGEDFMLEYSLNGGISYTVTQAWVSGTHFQNGQTKSVSVPFFIPFTNQTRFRIRCDASSNYDQVYIDDLRLYVCGSLGLDSDDNNISAAQEKDDQMQSYNLQSGLESRENVNIGSDQIALTAYPNPTTHLVNIVGLSGRSYNMYNMTGERMLSNQSNTVIDLSEYPLGTYLLRADDGEIIRIIKI